MVVVVVRAGWLRGRVRAARRGSRGSTTHRPVVLVPSAYALSLPSSCSFFFLVVKEEVLGGARAATVVLGGRV